MLQVFIGFGFLMTFLHAHSWSAVGYNFLLSAVAIQWSILTVEFFEHCLVVNGVSTLWGVCGLLGVVCGGFGDHDQHRLS